MAEKPPYLDWDAPEVRDDKFHGIAWVPTVGLRFVERYTELEGRTNRTIRILQQQWETQIVNNPGFAVIIHNPFYTQWRDVPLEEE